MILFKKIAWFKNYMGRAGSWMTLVNFFLIFTTWKQVYGLQIPAWMIAIGGILIFVIIGALDFRYILPYQMAHQDSRHRMAKQVDEIKRRLEQDGVMEQSKQNTAESLAGKSSLPTQRKQEIAKG